MRKGQSSGHCMTNINGAGPDSQKLASTILEYAEAFNKGPVPNDTAQKLLNEALKRSYVEKLGKVLPATKAARYLQIENKIRTVVKAELAQVIPLVY